MQAIIFDNSTADSCLWTYFPSNYLGLIIDFSIRRLWASHFPIDHIQQDLLGNRFGHASVPFFRAQPSHEMSSAMTSPSFSVSLLSSSSPRVSSFRTLEICADETPDTRNSSMFDEAVAMMNIDEDLKERLRRERIGMANRGRVPWNKGKRHTPGNVIFRVFNYLFVCLST